MRAISTFAIAAVVCGCSDPTTTYRIASITVAGPRNAKTVTVDVGARVPLTPHARTESGLEVIPLNSYVFVSRQPQIASVDTAGVVTGLSVGTTVVVASLDDSGRTLADSVSVSVTAPPAQPGQVASAER